MTLTASALYNFYSGFGIPAYEVNSIPDDAELPYITYSYSEPEWESPTSHYAQVYMRTNSNTELLEKAGQIVRTIGLGKRVPFESGGCLMMYPSTPLVQIMVSEAGDDIRSAYINLQLYAFHKPGF